jgi:hypothetical protein
MKHLKILGLAVVAAAALTALLGAGTASATELCKMTETPCTDNNMYTAGTHFDAMLVAGTTATIPTNIDTLGCKQSTISGELTTTGGATTTAVKGSITGLSFTECEDSFGTECAVTEEFLPASLEITGGGTTAGSTFSFKITSKAGVHVECGALFNCTFFTSAATLAGANQNGTTPSGGTPFITANNVNLSRIGGFCPSNGTWSAKYEVTEPMPLFVV